ANQTASPRELEAALLLRAAARLQAIRDGWDEQQSQLGAALNFNRRLWSIFLASVTRPDNPLPPAIRQNVANLGLFVCNHTLSVLLDPRPENLRILINVNREVAAGLRGNAG